VTGIDVLPEMAHTNVLETYYGTDNGIWPVIERLNGKQFDRVLLLDVLEHLKHPETLLRIARPFSRATEI
jgi:2-polyprenyl-3-methyl-5-hydroxy-6-metoxy-1,4-benzoquinol methylase